MNTVHTYLLGQIVTQVQRHGNMNNTHTIVTTKTVLYGFKFSLATYGRSCTSGFLKHTQKEKVRNWPPKKKHRLACLDHKYRVLPVGQKEIVYVWRVSNPVVTQPVAKLAKCYKHITPWLLITARSSHFSIFSGRDRTEVHVCNWLV